MKRIRIIFSVLFLCLAFSYNDIFASTRVNTRTEGNYLVPSDVRVTESNKKDILSTPAIDVSEKIYDFADILTEKEEKELYKQANRFVKETNLDYAIVTISKNPKSSTKQYAHDFYDYNNFSNNGVLFLLDMQKKSIYMVTKGSAVRLFPNDRMQPILKNTYSKVAKGEYYEACIAYTRSISEFVDIGLGSSDESVKIEDDGSIKVSKKLRWFEGFIFAFVGTGVIIAVMILNCKNTKKVNFVRDCLNRNTIKVMDISKMHLGTRTSKVSLANKK